MKKFLFIVSYQCFVNNEKTKTLDIQVIYKEAKSLESAKSTVIQLPVQKYENVDGGHVKWKFKEILSVEEFVKFEDGKELIGFIHEFPENK